MLIVKKFGGTSVADKERIFNVARRCIKDYQAGHDVVVVLSAMGKQTDVLIDMAKDINPKPPKRAMDMLLTTGEQTSVALMEMAMAALNVPAVSLNAFQVAMHTTSAYSNARLKRIDTERIRHEIDQRRLFYVAITRAKEKLFINYADTRRDREGKEKIVLPSRFLEEIPNTLFKNEEKTKEETLQDNINSAKSFLFNCAILFFLLFIYFFWLFHFTF